MNTEELFKKYANVYAGENDQLNMDYKSFTLLISEIKQLTLTDVGCQREQLITFLMKVGDCYGMYQRENAERCVDEIMSN